ncbi:MAG: tRNA dihydrouridine synthase DusB [Chlamydiales bacterium]|nr:tRNA dihydrouridine synthase DusB [Chlamydiales bacterium]
MALKRPFFLGKLELPSNIFCAPLAGCSDLPFRKMTSKYKPGLIYCEMVKMDALIRHNAQTFRLLDYEPSMHPIGAQLCGSKPEIAAECAKMIEDRGFDVLDLNCGCPVDKVTKDGSGSGMLKTPEKIGEIIANMVAVVKIPVTVKIRAGWDEGSIVGPLITKIAEEAGAAAICIHGRTREQGYRGPAKWDYIRECKQAAKTIKVIGNGDIYDAESAERIFNYTGCDAILVARGTMGQPWIIEDIYRHFTGLPPLTYSGIDCRDAFLEHLEHIVAYKEEHKAALDLRRVGCWFLRGIKGAKDLREGINRSKSIVEIRAMISNYPWHECSLEQAPQEEETCDSLS